MCTRQKCIVALFTQLMLVAKVHMTTPSEHGTHEFIVVPDIFSEQTLFSARGDTSVVNSPEGTKQAHGQLIHLLVCCVRVRAQARSSILT